MLDLNLLSGIVAQNSPPTVAQKVQKVNVFMDGNCYGVQIINWVIQKVS